MYAFEIRLYRDISLYVCTIFVQDSGGCHFKVKPIIANSQIKLNGVNLGAAKERNEQGNRKKILKVRNNLI